MIAQLEIQISKIDSAYNADVSSSVEVTNNFNGLQARIEALGKMENPWPSIFIMLLFLAIETAPVLAKLLSPSGSYEEVLKRLEKDQVKALSLENNNKSDFIPTKTLHRQLETIKEYEIKIDALMGIKSGGNEEKIKKYKEKIEKKTYDRVLYGRNFFVQLFNKLKEKLLSVRLFNRPNSGIS